MSQNGSNPNSVLDAHSRLYRIVNESDDDGLVNRAHNLLAYYDNAIVAAFHDGRGTDAETADEMRRFQGLANRLFRDLHQSQSVRVR